MKIGYPCINLTLACRSNRGFRLKSYSEELFVETVRENLECLKKILEFNVRNNLLFFRITSDLVPFASHPVCKFDWQDHFKELFKSLGEFINRKGIRLSMHPDQFTLINSISEEILERSKRELAYHAQVMDLMGLDTSAKIQIHVGGIYGNKEKSIKRFVDRYFELDEPIRRRLVIENDDKLYSLRDCIKISNETGLPVLFDVFHHNLYNSGESCSDAFEEFVTTWNFRRDGIPMVDYSSKKIGGKPAQHAESIDLEDFKAFLEETRSYDFDIMLEIKDKELSAMKAVALLFDDPRFKISLKA